MLPEHEWLAQAKRLAVGMKSRIKHRHEKRINLVIGNDPDKYWAYCQRCHEGGVVKKDHVLLGDTHNVVHDSAVLPDDRVFVRGSEYEVPVARFLATKNMALSYLPREVLISPKNRRLVIGAYGADGMYQMHGRDLTGKSAYKWMNYDHARITPGQDSKHLSPSCIVVEDLFSMFKVRWACHNAGVDVSIVCALGTGIKDSLAAYLMNFSRNIWFFDNDPAGNAGVVAGVRRMRPFAEQVAIYPPLGCDPKDMDCKDIVSLIKGVL